MGKRSKREKRTRRGEGGGGGGKKKRKKEEREMTLPPKLRFERNFGREYSKREFFSNTNILYSRRIRAEGQRENVGEFYMTYI